MLHTHSIFVHLAEWAVQIMKQKDNEYSIDILFYLMFHTNLADTTY